MKFFASFLFLFCFTTGYSFILDPKDYVEACKKNPTDTNSLCYGYYQGVIDSMFTHGAALTLCFNNASDNEILLTAVKGVTDFVNSHSQKEQEQIYPAQIIENTLREKFPCKNKA